MTEARDFTTNIDTIINKSKTDHKYNKSYKLGFSECNNTARCCQTVFAVINYGYVQPV